jgi:hypothetical protein
MGKQWYLSMQVLVCLMLFFVVNPTAAQNDMRDIKLPTPDAQALQSAVLNLIENDEKSRLLLAGAIHTWCEDLLNRIPRNTPAEDHWAKNESHDAVNSRDPKRIERVHNSVEYARMYLFGYFSRCVTKTKLIRDGQASRVDQALLWIDLVKMFVLSGEPYRLGAIIGLLPRNFSLENDENNMGILGLMGMRILDVVLPPIIKGQN